MYTLTHQENSKLLFEWYLLYFGELMLEIWGFNSTFLEHRVWVQQIYQLRVIHEAVFCSKNKQKWLFY